MIIVHGSSKNSFNCHDFVAVQSAIIDNHPLLVTVEMSTILNNGGDQQALISHDIYYNGDLTISTFSAQNINDSRVDISSINRT